DEGNRWRYIRSAQVSSGWLLFAWHQGRGMYRLGAVDLSGVSGETLPGDLEAVFTERDFSGGVSRPVAAGDAIFYRGTFSRFDALLRYPEGPAALSGTRVPLALKPWPAEDAARALPGFRDGMAGLRAGVQPPVLDTKPYRGISYMNPFKFWLPMPLIRQTGTGMGLSVDGGGILSLMIDPTDTNVLMLMVNFDARSPMAAGSVQWLNYALGFPLQFLVSDDLDKTGDRDRRLTTASLDGTFSFDLGNVRLDLIPKLNAVLSAEENGVDSSPYAWNYDEPRYTASLGLGLSSLMRPSWTLFGQGLSLYGYARFPLNPDGPYRFPSLPRFEGVFSAAAEPYLPLRLQVYGAWDEKGMDLHGLSGYYQDAAFSSAALFEYPRQGHISLQWLLGGEAELKLFSLDIQNNLSHFYYRRLYSTLSWRGALYDDQGIRDEEGAGAEGAYLGASPRGSYRLAQSLMLRLGMAITTVIVPLAPLTITPYGWGAWKFPNIYDDKGNNDFTLGIGLSVSF
ncbi:MAG: hypothetical protein LBG07_01940, partial [Treponema sp.]|nr:hypothetical protein [Treponema sp.]